MKNLKASLQIGLIVGLFIILMAFVLFYPTHTFTVKGVTELNVSYQVEKSYNSTEKYYENVKYYDNECNTYGGRKGDVTIGGFFTFGDTEYYDFFYKTTEYGGSCVITNISSSDTTSIVIDNSADVEVIYPILIKYFPVPDCKGGTVYYSIVPTVIYEEFIVSAGDSYRGKLAYQKVYDLRPESKPGSELTAFSFLKGDPRGCKQVEKVKQVEKIRPLVLTKNETLYKLDIREEELTIRASLVQKLTLGEYVVNYGCPAPYIPGENNSCYKKLED